MRILLVEDSDPLADLFRVQLYRLGQHDLVQAGSKKRGLELYKPGAFDVVFIDMGLEGIQDRGLEIIREIKAQAPEQRIGVLSSNDLQDMVRKSQQAGAEFYMVKPFTMEGLKIVLEGDRATMKTYRPEIGEGRILVL